VDDASHELRTPLAIIRGELELASGRPDDVAGMREALASALQEAEHLGRLTEDLLVLARSDRGRVDPRLDPVDLLEAARRAADRHGAGRRIDVDVAGTGVVVPADGLLVERVLGNLIDNACRHAAARVEVAVEADGDWARVTVGDDGPGFPTELLPVAFDRFTRADRARGGDGGGSGLGLAIVAALVRAHGGRVDVGNGEPLGGGRVRVWFPRARDGAEPVGDAAPAAVVARGAAPG
jgi:signal transduction histidine kinase